jgi:drug/metabolite transporter (DMT)-like permease
MLITPVQTTVSSWRTTAAGAVIMTAPPPVSDNNDAVWARGLLLLVAIGYGTNFPVGRVMNDALPAAASTSGRFALAALAMSPFVPKLSPSLIGPALFCGLFDAIGYCTQSLALVDVPAAKVSFLGALTVLWVPVLSAIVDGRQLGFVRAPQVWIAALLVLAGVGCLELRSLDSLGSIGIGDGWAVLQALAFGTSLYLIERMLADQADTSVNDSDNATNADVDVDVAANQVLPITAVNIAVVAAFSAVWACLDGFALGPFSASPTGGWLADEASRSAFALPGVLFGPVGLAFVWTGLATTALVRVGETSSLDRLPASDASVIIASEPLWAAVFGALLLGESLATLDLLGGALVCSACLVSAADPAVVRRVLGLASPHLEHDN